MVAVPPLLLKEDDEEAREFDGESDTGLTVEEESAKITSERVERDRLMLEASFSLIPVQPEVLARSDPAKSTKVNWPIFSSIKPPSRLNHWVTVIVKTVWDLLLYSLILVVQIVRDLDPLTNKAYTSKFAKIHT